MRTLPQNFAELGIEIKPHGSIEQRPPCPECGDVGAFSVEIREGRFNCFKCGFKGRVGRELDYQPITRFDDPAVAERKRERLRRTWKETVPVAHPKAYAVRNYLDSRALGKVLNRPPAVLRAHPGLVYWDGTRELGIFPAMVALFHGASGQPVTIHVTYLRSDGCTKASVPAPKKILGVPTKGATRGGAIHLYEPRDGKLGISEGIESALSLHLIQRLPVWSAFCADNLAHVYLPRDLRELHIGLDIDRSGKGEQVARDLAARVRKWSRRTKVWFVRPELDGPGDLNDELRRRAG